MPISPPHDTNPLRGGGDVEQLQKWAKEVDLIHTSHAKQLQRLATLIQTLIDKNNLKK